MNCEVRILNLEKIKNFINEKKKYIIIMFLVVLGGIYYFNSHKAEVDNSSLISPNISNNQAKDNLNTIQSSSTSKNIETNDNTKTMTTTSTKVTCDISGAVKHGGVYTLKQGARLVDLIEVAGGLTAKAQVKAINRAQLLKDQDQIYIPHEGEKVDQSFTTGTNSNSNSSEQTSSAGTDKIHLNSATVADLQKLSGVGQKRAEQIIQFRDANGGFKQIEDIKKVSGIGEKTFDKFKDQLAL